MSFVRACGRAELPPSGAHMVEVDGTLVALFDVDGTVYATSNACQHMGGPVGQGELDGSVVTCPWHGHTYDVTTGRCTSNADWSLETVPVRVAGDDVEVDVSGLSRVWRRP